MMDKYQEEIYNFVTKIDNFKSALEIENKLPEIRNEFVNEKVNFLVKFTEENEASLDRFNKNK